jgi:hypothetical protein
VRGRRRLARTIRRAKARIQRKIDIHDATPLSSNSDRRRLARTIRRAKARIQRKIDIHDATPLSSNSDPLPDGFTFLRNRHPSALVFETSMLSSYERRCARLP